MAGATVFSNRKEQTSVFALKIVKCVPAPSLPPLSLSCCPHPALLTEGGTLLIFTQNAWSRSLEACSSQKVNS